MMREYLLQSSGIGFTDVVNLAGIVLLMMVVYYYVIQEDPPDKATGAEARQRMTLSGLAFGFYAIVVGLAGHDGTWVGRVGLTLEGHFEEFAWQLTTIGDRATASGGPLSEFVYAAKILGLVAYVAIVSVVSFATTAVINAVQSVTP